MKNKIKFNHEYHKLKHINTKEPVTLIMLQKTHYTKLSPQFLQYDVSYEAYETDGYGHIKETYDDHYPIPCTTLMLLHFTDVDGKLFTTLREYKKKNWNKHYINVGHKYDVVMK